MLIDALLAAGVAGPRPRPRGDGERPGDLRRPARPTATGPTAPRRGRRAGDRHRVEGVPQPGLRGDEPACSRSRSSSTAATSTTTQQMAAARLHLLRHRPRPPGTGRVDNAHAALLGTEQFPPPRIGLPLALAGQPSALRLRRVRSSSCRPLFLHFLIRCRDGLEQNAEHDQPDRDAVERGLLAVAHATASNPRRFEQQQTRVDASRTPARLVSSIVQRR